MPSPEITGAEIPTDAVTTFEMLENNPAEVYARLRQTMPIARIAALNGRILFTKAEDTHRVKTDATHFGSHDTTTPMQRAFGGHTLMRKDGCPHLRERKSMEPAFRSASVQRWKPSFEHLTDQVLDTLAQHETVDLVSSFCAPISAGFVKLVLGIEIADDAQLFSWANALVRGAMNASFDPTIFEISDQANAEMNACFDQMIMQHKSNPDGSVLSTMANEVDPLTISQIRTNMKICIGGAVIETRDALASTLFGLLSNPIQLKNYVENSAWKQSCEEGLRWVAPIQASPRIVKKALVMHGLLIPEGETVMAVQASANHDEDTWDRPEVFDCDRPFHENQTFGDGAHQCLGGDTYRLLAAEVALPKLFDRFTNTSLIQNANVMFIGFAFRGPTTLPVNLA